MPPDCGSKAPELLYTVCKKNTNTRYNLGRISIKVGMEEIMTQNLGSSNI